MSRHAGSANIDQITDQLWIGGDLEVRHPELARRQLDDIESARITTILDVRLEWSDETWVTAAKPHLEYCWLGVDDAGQRMPDEWFETGTVHALETIRAGGVVLSHCHMGINRGPSMGFAILLALGWDAIEALDLMRVVRPIAYVAYAEDALDWWMRRSGATDEQRRTQRARITQWRTENRVAVAQVIRGIRRHEWA